MNLLSETIVPICGRCWTERNPDRLPARVRDALVETCGYCGLKTMLGIYVRDDQKNAHFTKSE